MFKGSMVALVTPMTHQGEVDYSALHALIDWHCEQQTDALVVLGTTGEAATLTFKEREHIIEQAVKRVNGRMPVIAGTGTNCTKTTLELTRQAALLGADAALISTPYYNRPTQAGLIAHYLEATQADLPIILYNIPGRTAVDMLPETVLALCEHPNIVGIKEGHSLDRCMTLLEVCPEDFAIISADDANALECIKAGGTGVMSVAANVVPGMMHHMVKKALSGDVKGAFELEFTLRPLFENLFVESNPIPVKYLLSRMSKINNILRLPLTPLSEPYQARLDQVLYQLKLLTNQSGVSHV